MTLTTKTKLEENIEQIKEQISTSINIFSAAAVSLNNVLNCFWDHPDSELEEILNEMGIENLNQVFTSHNSAATSINSVLDNANHSGTRAITTAPREIVIDSATGRISVIPLTAFAFPEINIEGLN